jgi:hypothetical protein
MPGELFIPDNKTKQSATRMGVVASRQDEAIPLFWRSGGASGS